MTKNVFEGPKSFTPSGMLRGTLIVAEPIYALLQNEITNTLAVIDLIITPNGFENPIKVSIIRGNGIHQQSG